VSIKVKETLGTTIWFDHSLLRGWTGIAQDARSVIKSLSAFYKVEYLPNFFFLSRDNALFRRISGIAFILLRTPFRLPSNLTGIYYQPQLSPFFPGRNISHWFVRIHDIFPITNPSWFRNASSRQFRLAWNKATQSNAIFICSSYYMKMLILKKYPELENRIEVVYCTARLLISNLCGICKGCELLASQPKLTDYFISVGTIEPRKNYHFLVENWLRFREIDQASYSLLIVGKKGWKSKKIVRTLRKFQSRASSNLIWIDTCCDGSLSKLYKEARAFISTSFDEGFNLPALEARSLYSLPLVLSEIPVHREFHSGYGIFFNNQNEFISALIKSRSELSFSNGEINVSSNSILDVIFERTKT
jgi:glycosyltransferase involved in cell wall biosynthesis